jgi:hypothetical protein
MGASARVDGFVASRSGLGFRNHWPDEPDVVVHLPIHGAIKIGHASNGLCGGMVFTVRDLFERREPPFSETDPPPGDSPLFRYIVRRLIDSWNLPNGVLKYYEWMNTPDGDTKLFLLDHRGLAYRTIAEEWPQIKDVIDAGHPAPVGLVTVHSHNPNDLGHCHQVLAHGYDLNDAGLLTLHLYDPNTDAADADTVRLSLSTTSPTRATAIQHNINIGWPVRGFFLVPYGPEDPSIARMAVTPTA